MLRSFHQRRMSILGKLDLCLGQIRVLIRP